MDVRYLLVARHAEKALDGALNALGAGFDWLWVPTLPHPISLFVAAKVSFERAEVGPAHNLRIRLIDPDGETMAEAGPIPVPALEIPAGMNYLNAQPLMGFGGLVLFKEGRYHAELLVDDAVEKRTPWSVRIVPSADQSGQESVPSAETANEGVRDR